MTNLGDARIFVSADVGKALSALEQLQGVFGNVAERVREVFKGFEISQPLAHLKVFSSVVAQLDSQLAQFNETAKKFELADEATEALEAFQKLRDTIASKELGPARVDRGEEEALQRALFLQQTQAASDLADAKVRAFEESNAAVRRATAEERALQESLFLLKTQQAAEEAQAKTQAYEQGLVAARAAIGEERALQEALFLLKTQGAHETAVAQQQAFDQAPKTARDEEQVQRALFLQITQGAHDAAAAKEQAFAESLEVARQAIEEERSLQEALFLLETQQAHDVATQKEQAYARAVEAARAAISEERALQEGLFNLQTQGAHEVALAKEKAFEISKRAAREEAELQQALFLQQTQAAHDAASQRQQEFDKTTFEGLRNALKEVRTEIKSLESDFLGLAKTEDFVAERTKLLAREQKLLADLGTQVLPEEAAEGILQTAEKVAQLNSQIERTRKLLIDAFGEVPPEGEEIIARIRQEVLNLGGAVKSLEGDLEGAPDEIQQVIDKYRVFTDEIKRNRLLIAEIRRELGAGIPTVLQDFIGKLVARNKELEKSIADLGEGAPAKGLQRFTALFGNAVDSVDAKLAGFGITMRDVAIILGSGFLSGGIALIVRSLVLFGKALVTGQNQIIQFGIQLSLLRRQVQGVFGDVGKMSAASQAIADMANNATEAFGITETAALRTAGRLGLLFESFDVGEEKAAGLTEGVFRLANILGSAPGAESFEQRVERIRELLSGSLESLRDYGIRIEENDLKQKAASLGLKTQGRELTSLEKTALTYLVAQDKINKKYDEFAATADNAQRSQETLAAEIDGLKERIGTALTPVVKILTDTFGAFVRMLNLALDAIGFVIDKLGDLVGAATDAIDALAGVIDKGLKAVGIDFSESEESLRSESEETLKAIIALAPKTESAARARKELARRNEEAALKERGLAESLLKTNEALELTEENLIQLRDAHIRLSRAIADSERAVAKAEENLARTRIDAAEQAADAQDALKDAYRDRNRTLFDANKKLQDAERQNQRSVSDAHDKLAQTQLEASRSIRDAEERLADERIQSTRRVRDAEENLLRIRQRIADAILNAQLSVEAALRKGDLEAFNRANLELTRARRKDELRKAERDLAEETSDSEKKLARLERDLAEERVDAAKRIKDAKEGLRRAVEDAALRMAEAELEHARAVEDSTERIEDAKRDLARTEMEINRQLFDAAEAVEEATRRGEEAIIDAKTALDDLNEGFGITNMTLGEILDKLEKMKNTVDSMEGDPLRMKPAQGTIEINAQGGFLPKGRMSLVGEQGPELVIANSNSTVISNQQLLDMFRRMMEGNFSGKSNVQQHVVVNQVANDPDATAFAVASRMVRGVG